MQYAKITQVAAPSTDSPATVQPLLELDSASQSFRTRNGETVTAISAMNLKLFEGEFVAIVGASGCGKTTLLRMIGGLILPTAGTIRYRGTPIRGPIPELGIVFQRPVLLEWLTIQRNITLQMKIRNMETPARRRELASELLKRVGLAGYENRYPWELSGGQQQRASLCRALIHKPSLLLMDEPFGALDALTREQLQADLEQLWIEQRPTVIFVTHDVGEAAVLADRVIVLSGRPGRVVEEIDVTVERPRAGALLENTELQATARHIRTQLSGH